MAVNYWRIHTTSCGPWGGTKFSKSKPRPRYTVFHYSTSKQRFLIAAVESCSKCNNFTRLSFVRRVIIFLFQFSIFRCNELPVNGYHKCLFSNVWILYNSLRVIVLKIFQIFQTFQHRILWCKTGIRFCWLLENLGMKWLWASTSTWFYLSDHNMCLVVEDLFMCRRFLVCYSVCCVIFIWLAFAFCEVDGRILQR